MSRWTSTPSNMSATPRSLHSVTRAAAPTARPGQRFASRLRSLCRTCATCVPGDADGALRRLLVVPADHRAQQDAASRIRLHDATDAVDPVHRHPPGTPRHVVPQAVRPALPLLQPDVEGTGMSPPHALAHLQTWLEVVMNAA